MNFRSMGSGGKDGQPPGFPPPTPLAGLARQSSVYSLTFDEFQSTMGGIGKDFGSMNMDEFLKSIWTAEETQAMTSVTAAVEGSAAAPPAGAGMVGLPRQGSLTLPRTLSQKTVDEVWKDLFREGSGSEQGPGDSTLLQQQRQPTLGEMTLEEFLVRAGVVREDLTQSAPRPIIPSDIGANGSNNNNVFYGDVLASNLNSNLALGFHSAAQNGGVVTPNPVPNNMPMSIGGARPPYAPPMQLGDTIEPASQQGLRGGGGIMGIGDPSMNSTLIPGMAGLGAGGVTVPTESPESHLQSDGPGKSSGDMPSPSPVPYVFNGGVRGRKCGGAVEKVVERRQRRMIKNRESAARSRARKQAYIMELEAEVAKLKEQNQELEKKQAAILEMQKNQVLEKINQQCGSKKRCLRRTQTGPCALLHSSAGLPEFSVKSYFR